MNPKPPPFNPLPIQRLPDPPFWPLGIVVLVLALLVAIR